MAYELLPVGTIIGPAGGVASPWPLALTTGEDAMGVLAELRADQPSSTPVLVGPPKIARDMVQHALSEPLAPDAILAEADGVDCEAWLADREAEIVRDRGDPAPPSTPSLWQQWLGRRGGPRVAAPASIFPRGPWPANVAPNSQIFSLRETLTRQLHPALYIALLPCAQGWQACAHTKLGGWNDCPDPSVQVAFARRWRERHGAAPAACCWDVLEFTVARPVGSRAEALELAREQFLFCADIVEQGTETVDALAAALLGATAWYFWWD